MPSDPQDYPILSVCAYLRMKQSLISIISTMLFVNRENHLNEIETLKASKILAAQI